MKYATLLSIVLAIILCSCGNPLSEISHTEVSTSAPFAMPAIRIPDFTNCPTFSIVDYGAVTDDQDKNTRAIAQSIKAANAAGCGRVLIPAGRWLTGKIHLKSNVNLHLADGAELYFSGNPADYLPAVRTTWEGVECMNYSPLIYAYECQNVAITGPGKLEADMTTWETWFGRPPGHLNSLKQLYFQAAENVPLEARNVANDTSRLRPHFIQFNRCAHVLLEEVQIRNSPFWTIHPYLSKDIVIRNVNIRAAGHNTDGVDPEMSQNVFIADCVFDQGDDAVAVKSGRNQEAWRLNTPTKNVVIKNCLVKNGHQLLAIGSELSGGVENIFVDSCEVAEGAELYHVLYVKTNERRGGYVNNVHVSNVRTGAIDKGVIGIQTDVLYQWRDLVPTLERRLTPIKHLTLTNVRAKKARYVSRIVGQAALPVDSISLRGVTVDSLTEPAYQNENVRTFTSDHDRTANFPAVRTLVDEIPPKENLWIFLLAGQSNMAGRGFVEPVDTVTSKRIIAMGEDFRWYYAKEPLHFYEPRLTGLDCGLSFARELLNHVPDSITIGLVPCAIGGSAIAQWTNDELFRGVKLLSNFRNRAQRGQAAGLIKGILWHQGGSDAKSKNIPPYAALTEELFTEFRKVTGEPALPILVGALGTFKTPPERQMKFDSLNVIIRQTAALDSNRFVVRTEDLTHKGDYSHFDAKSLRVIGNRFAKKYREEVLDRKDKSIR